jgi:hypothetical protein
VLGQKVLGQQVLGQQVPGSGENKFYILSVYRCVKPYLAGNFSRHSNSATINKNVQQETGQSQSMAANVISIFYYKSQLSCSFHKKKPPVKIIIYGNKLSYNCL